MGRHTITTFDRKVTALSASVWCQRRLTWRDHSTESALPTDPVAARQVRSSVAAVAAFAWMDAIPFWAAAFVV